MKISNRGTSLAVTDTGAIDKGTIDTGAGEVALVFLHFWGGSSGTWSAVVSRLRDRFRCVAIDARGAGDSEAPTAGYRTADHAADALAVVESLALDRFILVGHSMGGKAAQWLASRRPRGLQGLALVASSPPSPMAIDERRREGMRGAYADRASIDWTLDNVLLGSAVPPEVRESLAADMLRLKAPGVSGWPDVGSREDIRAEVANLQVPVMIVAGELDRVDPLPVVRRHIVPCFPAAELHLLPEKGHLLPVEAPAEVAGLLEGFARKVQASRTQST